MTNGRYVRATISQVHNNTDQELIQITDDKLRLILSEHLSAMERTKDWIAPLGVLLSVIGVFVSAEFKDALLLKAAVWQAIFILIGISSTIWLVKCLIDRYRCPSMEDVIVTIKNSPNPPSSP